jgi:hypothetical protein
MRGATIGIGMAVEMSLQLITCALEVPLEVPKNLQVSIVVVQRRSEPSQPDALPAHHSHRCFALTAMQADGSQGAHCGGACT